MTSLMSSMGAGGGASAADYAAAVAAFGATNYYPMTTDATDVIGGQNGTPTGTGTATFGGTLASSIQGVSFSAVTKQITCSTPSFLPAADCSTVFWIKSANSSRVVWLLQDGVLFGGRQPSIQANTGNTVLCSGTKGFFRRFAIGLPDADYQCSVNDLCDNNPHMLAAVVDNTANTCLFYVDGTVQGAAYAIEHSTGTGSNNLNIGFSTLSDASGGLIGGVAQFNGVKLTAGQIASLVALGNA